MAASAFQTITIMDDYVNSRTVWLPHPFRLRAGESLQIPFNAEYNSFRYFGLLMDDNALSVPNVQPLSDQPDFQFEGGPILEEWQ